ncbi:GTP binding domain protein [Fusarium beomiforme]|uniref:GTP binding domain protein n=1 Tax=Fusarium beomiforme TaxID=44412 RepID=A0A9P5DWD8_9HYPO|nr:GTP binding domain protein [Fusarium beomiforme]
MGAPSLGAESLVDQAESFRTFLGLNRPEPGDKFFLVNGLTGAGKSTFIANCTGHSVVAGHGLYSSTYLGASYSTEKSILEKRELELVTNQNFFSDLVSRGARMFRHYEEGYSHTDSGRRIVDELVRQLQSHTPDILQLQREVVDEKKSLGETAAGIAAAEYLHKTSLEHQNQLKSLNTELKRTSKSLDDEYSLQLRELKAEVDKDIRETERGRQALAKTMIDLHQAETRALKQRIINLESQFKAEVQNKEIMLQDVQESCDALQKEMARLAKQPQQQQLVARRTKNHQKALVKAQKDVEKCRKNHQKVQAYTREIVGGVMNGIAAGAVAGVMGSIMCTVM